MSIPGAANPLLLRTAAAGGYQISRSLRFNSSDSAFCSRTFSSSGNRKTWTWSGWVKRSALGGDQVLFGACPNPGGADNDHYGLLISGDALWSSYYTGSQVFQCVTSAVLRDTSAWYHITVAFDTTQATASNRIKIYVNGSLQSLSTANYPSLNYDGQINSAIFHSIGKHPRVSSSYLSGYLAEVFFIDGQALDPSSFVETSATTGQLIPKAYTGTFTGNSFWLKFADNSAATATTLGKDSSGLGNNWTPNNLTATELYGRLYRQATGTATSAFSSANLVGNFPASASGNYIYDVELNTSVTTATFGYLYNFGGVEVLVSNDGANWTSKGVQTNAYTTVTNSTPFKYVRWFIAQSWMHGITNNPANIDSTVDTPSSAGTDTGVGGVVTGNYCTLNPVAFKGDASSPLHTLSNGNLQFSSVAQSGGGTDRLGTIPVSSGKWYWEVTAASIQTSPSRQLYLGVTTPVYTAARVDNFVGIRPDGAFYNTLPGATVNSGSLSALNANDVIGYALDLDNLKLSISVNGTFHASANPATGANPNVTLPSGVTLVAVASEYYAGTTLHFNFGQRQWAYAAPAGFKALCDTNLPAPVVAKPSSAFDVKLYTGNGSTQTISGLGFSPDLVWLKCRSAANTHALVDSVRGATKYLVSAATDAEVTDSGGITSLNSDGFSLTFPTSTAPTINANSATYAAWCWDAGTTTTTNTQGSITTSLRASPSSGFSLATWSGTGSGSVTVGHGLGVAPQFFIVKDRSNARNWLVYHVGMGATRGMQLNLTTAQSGADAGYWNNTAPTSTVATIGTYGNEAANYVGYFWAPVVGYSAMGSYVGNGSADGPFVYTGFRPRFVLIKGSSFVSNWNMYDAARDSFNITDKTLRSNSSAAEFNSVGQNEFALILDIVSNGFKIRSTGVDNNSSGASFIYCAFAESPLQYARAR